MIQNEYLNVREISIRTSQSTRNVRRKIKKLVAEVNEELLHQDKNNSWRIHHLLLSRFKPLRIRKIKYYALTIDPCFNYTELEIDRIMEFVIEQVQETGIEINYVIEKKKSNNQNHIHCFVKCNNRNKLLQSIRLGFSQVSYHQSDIFDLGGWREYISKENNNIKTIKKQEK